VMAGIERLMVGRTTFIIAHRLSTVRRCDRILVLRGGAIVEQGTLPELLRLNGFFAEYYRTQFAPEEEHPGAGRVSCLSSFRGFGETSDRHPEPRP
jgi:ATP-binding cassette, subfamily B, bacterial